MAALQAMIVTSATAETPPALSEIPAAQWKRVVELALPKVRAKLLNMHVIPHWIGTTDSFWYKRESDIGDEYFLVDAASGAKRPLFDRTLLATSLSRASHTTIRPSELPVALVSDNGDSLTATIKGGESYRCSLVSVPACTPTTVEHPDGTAANAPDGRIAVFVRGGNLWLRDLASREERALTTDGTKDFAYATAEDTTNARHIAELKSGFSAIYGVSWSPDSKRVLVPRIDQRHVAQYPYIANVPTDGSFRPQVYLARRALVGERAAVVDWFIIDIGTRTQRHVNYPDAAQVGSWTASIIRTHWSEDGRSILTLGQGYQIDKLHLFQVDAQTGDVRTVVSDDVIGTKPWGFGVASIPFRSIDNGQRAIVPVARDGYINLDLVEIATGRRQPITRGSGTVRAILGVDETRRTVVFAANGREPGDPYSRYIYRVGLDGRGRKLLSPEPGDRQLVDPLGDGVELDGSVPYAVLSPSSRFIVYGVSTLSTPPSFVIRRTSNAALIGTFERGDASKLFAAGYRPPEPFVARAADGAALVHGVVYRPRDYDPKRKYPVLDFTYASPVQSIVPHGFDAAATNFIGPIANAAAAEMGFVVVVIDARGTPYRALDFSTPKVGYLATMGLEDHVAFIRQLGAVDPGLDLERIGIAGASFGGWAALRGLIEFPDFYKVGIAATVPARFQAMYAAPTLLISQGVPRYGGIVRDKPDPLALPDNYVPIDSARQVQAIKGRLLLITGEQDESVLPAGIWQFFDAAQRADKDVELIQIPNAGHGASAMRYPIHRALKLLSESLNGLRLPAGAEIPSPVPPR